MVKEIHFKNHTRIIIDQGDLFATGNKEHILSTALGSCVAVCLFDPAKGIIGMNHIVNSPGVPAEPRSCQIRDARDGYCAINLLIEAMIRKGADRRNIKAKLVGGASLAVPYEQCRGYTCTARSNNDFARTYLKSIGIPIVAEDLGGERSRAVKFYVHDFSLEIKKIDRSKLFSFFKMN